MQIKFKALDYTADDRFIESEYEYSGETETGWKISRNGETYLEVGPGYRLLKTKSCGVCSTDIDRRFLPHPLPQIIGHEVLAESVGNNEKQRYVVEINDTWEARGSVETDAFCREGIPTHSPERKVLGIDRLPGGFGPYLLVPKNAAIPLDGISDKAAVLMEPFAAALQAMLASPPKEGDRVAVLGPRRLGSLVLAALSAYRTSSKTNFHITAITRHDHLITLSKKMGADVAVDLRVTSIDTLKSQFDIVYDTTSTPSGFLSAIEISKRELHLKTTNGQTMGGLQHLTELVVDELSLLPVSESSFQFIWPRETRKNKTIFVFGSMYERWKDKLPTHFKVYHGSPEEAVSILEGKDFEGLVPRFDLVLVESPDQIAKAIRPIPGSESSLVRPRSAILVDSSKESLWEGEAKQTREFFQQGKQIRSSRCGDFHFAIQLLKENPSVVNALEENMISHQYSASDLTTAYSKAKEPSSVKVVVNFP
ncbi:Zn-dependent alcohol dehydrogenase [Leptospira ryugenii]|uniref:Zn-dependent alcohol dehydrogenase n=1 Tax=Leptospira ryugenii TaxID=1917863 RepID=A0A2P2E3P7_9LEPT|nr:alcohol dehydrogenase catalytic domain-containing protein [Leptospira ryugenii]GBF51489.1 Zn-dependent alcohol dehydrogenase [Leptospira ryugenii]